MKCCVACADADKEDRKSVRDQIMRYDRLEVDKRWEHVHGHVEGFYLTDPSHPALRHNRDILKGLGVRVNQERGLRAKTVSLCPSPIRPMPIFSVSQFNFDVRPCKSRRFAICSFQCMCACLGALLDHLVS